MARIEKTIEINVPHKNVWSYISNPKNFIKWAGTVDTINIIEETQKGVGTTAQVTIGDMEVIMKVVEVVENRKIVSQAIEGDLTELSQSFTLDPIENGTRLTYMLDYQVPKALGGKLLDMLLVRRTIDAEMENGIERLKKDLEQMWTILSEAEKR
ncbi:MAG: SRPBCC family protein [Candidatus Bathyarchaeota archaeon]|nr:SRPBCC family protein [Candidatus Bathyarchaeota archaeon]